LKEKKMKNEPATGDWVRLTGLNYTIYGKVTNRSPETGEMQIITSIPERTKSECASGEMNIVKVDREEVPKKARLWILSREEQPTPPGREVMAPARPKD
jgi:hypothetical protein